ncbi:unnamed protein product [Ceratitis capitata]|uniref:(Mediterranean fruit fly) hypothetical protein n=1 Tax=Ceratitis capitata TaxID=7213 RepID=A0A811UEE0_CERCA|nr:unnamed protein product [Ceratitis capitata]
MNTWNNCVTKTYYIFTHKYLFFILDFSLWLKIASENNVLSFKLLLLCFTPHFVVGSILVHAAIGVVLSCRVEVCVPRISLSNCHGHSFGYSHKETVLSSTPLLNLSV